MPYLKPLEVPRTDHLKSALTKISYLAKPEDRPSLILQDLKFKTSDYWTKIREKFMLKLFHSAAQQVPAYKDFLKKNKLDETKIKTLKDFQYVPPIDKKNYLFAYSYDKLAWDGNNKKPITIHSTSGSTGEPAYFQRAYRYDLIREVIIENFFRLNQGTIQGPTLFIITFGMGVWSAGMGIYTAAYLASNFNNFPISIITPGVNKAEVLKILKNLAPNYKQVVIAGYPPFIKDILDEAPLAGINLKKMDLRFVFTGEAFTEEFRNYLTTHSRVRNILLDTMNTYGTSELGAVAVETPLSIMVRRLAYKKQSTFKDLFGGISKTPTLAQYIPYFVNFESLDGELLLTGDSPIPLIRYKSGDSGGIWDYKQLNEVLTKNGINVEAIAKKLKVSENIYQLPLVYIYERRNLTANLYGILIFPEFIKTALLSKKLSQFLSGKFTMLTKHDQKHEQYLEINLELKKGYRFKKDYTKSAGKEIFEALKSKSSEFRELIRNTNKDLHPKLVFWNYEDPIYFAPTAKQSWVKK